jgi:hypothetical protein
MSLTIMTISMMTTMVVMVRPRVGAASRVVAGFDFMMPAQAACGSNRAGFFA